MNNYWLSEYESLKEEDDEETPEDSGDSEDPQSKLNDRQQLMYEQHESCVDEHGKFDQTAGPNGSHYAPGSKNPFIKEGLVCSNCVFFMGGQACELVSGKIEPTGICKLWIIPGDLIKK